MRARIIFNLVLVAGAIALAVLWWATRPAPEQAPKTISSVAFDAVARMEVHTADNVIVLARDNDGDWRLRQPIEARADPAHVAALKQLASATPTRELERDAIDAGTTGVDDPWLTVRFGGEAPISVGHEGPAPGSHYVRTAHALLLASLPDLASQSLDWTRWIAPRLIDPDAKLTKLTLPHLTLTQAETGGWRVQPVSADRGADYAQATVDAWRHARALAIEPADAGQERIARVTLGFAGGDARHLDVISRSPELVLRDVARGLDYHLAANQAAPLLEMRHPDTLGRGRAAPLQPSAIPLQPTDDAPVTQ